MKWPHLALGQELLLQVLILLLGGSCLNSRSACLNNLGRGKLVQMKCLKAALSKSMCLLAVSSEGSAVSLDFGTLEECLPKTLDLECVPGSVTLLTCWIPLEVT